MNLKPFADPKTYRKRYARWSAKTWDYIVSHAVPQLLASSHHMPHAHQQKILDGYLTLSAESIGLGWLYHKAESVHSVLWLDKIPSLLGRSGSHKEQLEVMVDLWNLCAATQAKPAWLQTLLYHELRSTADLGEIHPKIAEVAKLLAKPDHADTPSELTLQVVKTEQLGFFLPVKLEFAASPVLQVSGLTPGGYGLRISVYVKDGAILATDTLHDTERLEPVEFADDAAKFARQSQPSLTPVGFAANFLAAALIFQESQNIWLWTRRTT